jgi:hypothetical protein
MNAINDFFQNVAEFIKYVPGISANLELNELNSSAISARKQIRNIITKDLWEKIKDEDDTDARHYLTNAFGNLIMHKALVFDVIAKRIAGTADVYKHELETMRRQYIDNYYNAMDSLIEELSSNDLYSVAWQATPDYKMIDELKIKSTTDFNGYYGIDLSYLFFFRTIPLQREILIDGMKDVFEKSAEREDLTSKLKLALSQLVVALALSRFDIIELPSTIRSLFDEQKTSRSGSEEQNRIITLAAELRNNAIGIITAVELALSDPLLPELVSDTSFNTPDDKIYLIS